MQKESDVIIVGAGIAGLVAADILKRKGFNVIILEARDRIGGRIHSLTRHGVTAELGAELIHGSKIKTWEIIKDAKAETLKGPDEIFFLDKGVLHGPDSSFSNELKSDLKSVLSHQDKDASFVSVVSKTASAKSTKEALTRSVLELEGADETLSLKGLDEGYFFPDNFILPGGYSCLCEFLAKDKEIRLKTQVCAVKWDDESGCTVNTLADNYLCKAVMVTVPLGVLKQNIIKFSPPLPFEKEQAIKAIGMGSSGKLELWFKERVWDFFGIIVSNDLPGAWWPRGKAPVISCMFGGSSAERFRRLNKEAVVDLVCNEIESVTGKEVKPLLIDHIYHDWVSDPYCFGGYSFNPVGIGKAREVLTSPVGDRIYFAGEACSTDKYATVNGAIQSAVSSCEDLCGFI